VEVRVIFICVWVVLDLEEPYASLDLTFPKRVCTHVSKESVKSLDLVSKRAVGVTKREGDEFRRLHAVQPGYGLVGDEVGEALGTNRTPTELAGIREDAD